MVQGGTTCAKGLISAHINPQTYRLQEGSVFLGKALVPLSGKVSRLLELCLFPISGGPSTCYAKKIMLFHVYNLFLLLINPPPIINNKSGNPKMPHEHFKRGCTNFKRSKTIMN